MANKADIIVALDHVLHHGFGALVKDITPELARQFRSKGISTLGQFKVGAESLHVIDHRAMRYAQERGAELITQVSDTTRDDVRELLEQAIEEGWSAGQLAAELREHETFSPERALKIARTEEILSYRAGGREAAQIAGATEKRWLTAADACPLCLENSEAGWITMDGEFPNGDSVHPNCLVGNDIQIIASSITASFERWFQGKIVRISIERYPELTLTVNHPILTNCGWIPAGKVQQGEYLAVCPIEPFAACINPDNQQMPIRIKDVARTLWKAGGVPTRGVPLTAEDFHGDGTLNGNVDIIRAAGRLSSYSQSRAVKCRNHLSFIARRLYALTTLSAPAKLDKTCLTAARSNMSRSSDSLTFIGAAVTVSEQSRLTGGPQLHTSAPQQIIDNRRRQRGQLRNLDGILSRPIEGGYLLNRDLSFARGHITAKLASDRAKLCMNRAIGTTEAACQFLDAATSFIEFQQVVSVRQESFSGIVRNCETPSGSYLADGFIVANCSCSEDYRTAEQAEDDEESDDSE